MTTEMLNQLLADIAPTLRKYAAHHSGTAYAHDLADMAPEAQDLYQHAVNAIINKGLSPTDTKKFALKLADWRMSNLAGRERNIYSMVIEDTEPEQDDDDHNDVIELLHSENDNPEDIIIMGELATRLHLVTAALKPEQAVMVRLLREGCGLPEIAARLGITYDAAWKRLLKVREAFQSAGLTPALAVA